MKQVETFVPGRLTKRLTFVEGIVVHFVPARPDTLAAVEGALSQVDLPDVQRALLTSVAVLGLSIRALELDGQIYLPDFEVPKVGRLTPDQLVAWCRTVQADLQGPEVDDYLSMLDWAVLAGKLARAVMEDIEAKKKSFVDSRSSGQDSTSNAVTGSPADPAASGS